MMICVLVSWRELTLEDFNFENKSDLFSACFLIISMISLMCLPIYMLSKINKYFKTLDDDETREEYGYIYEDLATKSKLQASFHVVYILRRALFVVILFYLEKHSSLQLCFHMILTMFYIMYFAHIEPYEVRVANDWEIFNEVCIMQVTYCLAMTTSPYLTPEDKYLVGWVYIFIVCLNILVNFSKIIKKMAYEAIPDVYRGCKKKQDSRWYKKKLDKWIEDKLHFCKSHPNVTMVDEMLELTEII